MGNFLDVASDLLLTGKVDEKREHFVRVFSAIGSLQVVHSKAQLDLNNIESIFTVLELGRTIQRVPGLTSDGINDAIASLKTLIVSTLQATITFPVRGRDVHAPPPYPAFAQLIKFLRVEALPQHTVSVITFNYDIAADVALLREGLGPDYILESAPDCINPVPLLKLHGSTNWAIQHTTRRIRPAHLKDYFKTRAFGNPMEPTSGTLLSVGSELPRHFSQLDSTSVEAEPVIVPPSWNKADYHHALSDVWAAAAKNLSEAEHIFIIGYSLPETDSFFRHLYALGSVGKSTLRRLVVYNPDTTGETDRRFRALLGPGAAARYDYRPATFQTAIGDIKSMFPKRP